MPTNGNVKMDSEIDSKSKRVNGSRNNFASAAPQLSNTNEFIWITATSLLIAFLVISSQVFVIIPYFLFDLPVPFEQAIWYIVKLLIPFNIGAIGIVWNYYNCVTLDPGGIPKGWHPPEEVLEAAQRQQSELYEIRFCKPCRSFKPPRAHHCRTCKRCTLRMDHHCPWIGNCVGQRNYANFIRFLACVDITCAMHLLLLTARVADFWWIRIGGQWRPPSTLTMVIIILNYALCTPTILLVGVFSIYHFWCAFSNTTTIESWEKDKVERWIRRGRIRGNVIYPFDLGFLNNFKSVFGKSILSWISPSVITLGDGLQFPISSKVDLIEQYFWPPSDPNKAEQRQRKPNLTGNAFTYGTGLNPNLEPSSSVLRQRKANAYPPWHPDYQSQELDAAQEAQVDTTDTCLPPVNRNSAWNDFFNGTDSNPLQDEDDSNDDEETFATSSRVRRGSEGYEVRPKRYDVAFARGEESEDDFLGDYGNYNDFENDEKAWEWKQKEMQEEILRQQLQQEKLEAIREQRLQNDNVKFSPESTISNGDQPLLPSKVMQIRQQQHDYFEQKDINK